MTNSANPTMDPEQQRQFGMVPIDGSEPEGEAGQTYTPEGEEIPGQSPGVSGEQIVGPLLGLLFGVVAERRGDHWRLTDAEQRELARTGGAVMDHYMPMTAGPLGSFAVCMSVALGPRVMVEREMIKKRKEKERKRSPEAGEGSGDGD